MKLPLSGLHLQIRHGTLNTILAMLTIFESSLEFAGAKEGARVGTVVVGAVVGPRRTKKTQRGWGRGWGCGGGGTQAVGADGSAGGPCGVLYGKHSMFLVRKGSRDICSQQLIELACT